jgi:anti-anti-sigma factor
MSSSSQNRAPLAGRGFACPRRAGPPGGAQIVMTGELDVASAARARAAIARAQADSAAVVCDLRGLSFIDVRGVHVLLDAAADARCNGGRLTVAHPPATLLRLLGLLGLEHALEIESTPSPRSHSREGRDGARSRHAPARAAV